MLPDALSSLDHRLRAAGARLRPTGFAAIAGFDGEDHLTAVNAILNSAKAVAAGLAPTRPAAPPDPAFAAFCSRLTTRPPPASASEARAFLERHFAPWRIEVEGRGFITGYYEPEVAGSLSAGADFTAPILPRPADLVTFAPHASPGIDPPLSAARQSPSGVLSPYPTRARIEQSYEALGLRPLVWLEDWVEVFMIHVQGSARVRLDTGEGLRLGYAGRNGHPYASIGRHLIASGAIAEGEMTLDVLKRWLRRHGQGIGDKGRETMWLNPSYIFFKFETGLDPDAGPIGGAGLALEPLRSIAVDRSLWFYGLPFWIDAVAPWRGARNAPLRRLMVAADTGSAILGPARADLFFGAGPAAGAKAGAIRHPADFTVLLPVWGS